MNEIKHNSDLCNKDCMRCVHCCGLDYNVGRSRYELMFARRREIFDERVKKFPEDLIDYVAALSEEGIAAIDPPCVYLGNVDDNPGCMIHPSRFDGIDVRAQAELIQVECLPKHGCYFPNYLRTINEKKIFEDFLSEAKDWHSYSLALRNCAYFNKKWSYLISRLPFEKVGLDNITRLIGELNEDLRQRFPVVLGKGSSSKWGPDLSLVFREVINEEFSTENYMAQSPLFKKWGYKFGAPVRGFEIPHFEVRFRNEDFSEWGYFGDSRRPLYVYLPLGEILPIQFLDVAIYKDDMLKEAINIVDRIL
jgi:hypothetical protein